MIAIKDMEMPKSCEDCPISVQWAGDMDYCKLCGKGNRMDCPLIEIVTCKYCKHRAESTCLKYNIFVYDNFYCKDGKRRE